MTRRITSLMFEIDPTPGNVSACIVIPVDRIATRICRPVYRGAHWLDIKRGHQLYVSGKRRTVQRVRLYRTNEPLVGEIVVESGREWLDSV